MPVSLERLIAEVEPCVITEELTRECIQVTGADIDVIEDKKQSIPFKEVESLAFSFKNLARIDSLQGLDKLVKLQLDNNHIPKIENIKHLTNLTWLDLSFNKICKIEGLDTLTKLMDLSLFNNQISTIENLDNLVHLNVLSLGNNAIAKLDNVSYLRRFNDLKLVNLAGNPMCKDSDYKSYVLSHIKNLTYMDYRRVNDKDVTTAVEQHQDEMLELHEREEAAATEQAHAAERAAHGALMAEANLDGIETLLDDMASADSEWSKMSAVPGLLEPWNDVRDKWQVATEEFKLVLLDAHSRKKSEHTQFRAALATALFETDSTARQRIAEFEKAKKRALGAAGDKPGDVIDQVNNVKMKLVGLQHALLELETDTIEVVAELCQEFDRSYSEMAEANKLQYNSYFTQVRDLENAFSTALNAVAPSFVERYGAASDNPELESMPEEAQLLLQDKDAMMNAIQTSHDIHISKIDGLEDRLVATELRRANDLADANAKWEAQRHRDRTAEILSYLERNVQELDVLATDAADADMGEG
eukprot:jgi/Chrzof1/10546/Cz05g02220.t1